MQTWIHCARPSAAALIVPPLLLGQAMAFYTEEVFAWAVGLWVLGCAFALQLCIGLWLAYADARYEDDALADPRTLFRASALATLLLLGLGLFCAWRFDRSLMPLFFAVGLIVLWTYRFPPLSLDYRGGEFLQALGLGLLLPLIGYYAQTGSWHPLPRVLFPPYIFLQLAAALAVFLCLVARYLLAWNRDLPTLVLGLMLLPVAALLACAPLRSRLDDSPSHQRAFKRLVLSPAYIYALGFTLAQFRT